MQQCDGGGLLERRGALVPPRVTLESPQGSGRESSCSQYSGRGEEQLASSVVVIPPMQVEHTLPHTWI